MHTRTIPNLTSLFLLLSIIIVAGAFPVTGAEIPETQEQQISHQSSIEPEPQYAPHQILVRFNTPENTNGTQVTATADQIAAIHESVGATVIKSYAPEFLSGLQLVRIPDTMTVPEAIAWYKTLPSVRYAEPDAIIFLKEPEVRAPTPLSPKDQNSSVPNDPYYPYQWSLHNTGQQGGTPGADIKAEGAWNITTGSRDVVVAVIDTGVDYLHPDLIDNIWTDPITGEHGYDFVNNDSNPMDDDYHGTACAGLIAATGNNSQAMTGVAWKTRIMALKWIGKSGWGIASDAISSIEYAMTHDADIISNSWNLYYKSDALIDAVNRFPGLVVWSAANDTMNIDGLQAYAHFHCLNVVSVMASDNHDTKASFSNFGRTSVHLDAPGEDILLIVPQNYTPSREASPPPAELTGGISSRALQNQNEIPSGGADIPYIINSGTSFAAPLVAGTAALIMAEHPEFKMAQIKSTLLQSVDPIPALSRYCITGGRLNASAALSHTLAAYDAIGEISLPSKIHPGSTCPIAITVQNAGTDPWTPAGSISLRADNSDASRFNTGSYPLPVQHAVNPGESVVFVFNGTAPTEGMYRPQYRMQQNTSAFGPVITGYISVTRAEVLPEIPRAFMGSALVSDGGYLYLLGGYDVNTSEFSDLVYRYDIKNQTWSELTPMPQKLGNINAGVINDRIYIPGGRTGYGWTDPTTYIYDIRTDQWSSLEPNSTPPGLSDYKTAVLGDRLYVLGGTVWRYASDLVYYLNTTTATWYQAPSMQVPRTGFAASSGNNTILVAGGYTVIDRENVPIPSAERFDGATWTRISDIPDTHGWHYMASASEPDGSLWMAGGYRNTSDSIALDHVATYNLSLNQWRVSPDEAPIWYPRKIVIGAMNEDGYFYTAQGGDYESYLGQFERMQVYIPELKGVSDLHTTRILPHLITWNWTVPDSGRVDTVQVALDGVMKTSLPPENASYTATRLRPDTSYQVSVRTVDAAGNPGKWMNNSAKTAHWYR